MKTAIYFSALALAILSGCTTPNPGNQTRGIAAFSDDPRLGETVSKICFNRNIDGFSSTTRDTVVVKRGVSDEYIVEVFGSCPDLEFARRIALDSYSSCLSDGDHLIVYDSAFGADSDTRPQRCAVRKIHKWDSDAHAEDETDARAQTSSGT